MKYFISNLLWLGNHIFFFFMSFHWDQHVFKRNMLESYSLILQLAMHLNNFNFSIEIVFQRTLEFFVRKKGTFIIQQNELKP